MSGEAAIGSIWIGTCDHNLPCCPHLVVGTLVNGAKSVRDEMSPASKQLIPYITHNGGHCSEAFPYKGSPSNLSEEKFQVRQNDFALTTGCNCILMCVSSRQTVRSDY
jgi:hypothetical protein